MTIAASRSSLFQFSRGDEAVHARHRDIHDDDVRPRLARLLDGAVSIAGFRHDFHVVLAIDQQLESMTHGHVIVRQKNAKLRGSSCSLMTRCVLSGRAPAAIRTRMVVPLPTADSICKRRTHESGPLLHANQPESLTAAVLIDRLESDTIVFDDEGHAIRPPLEHDVDVLGARVFGDVVERFLRDSIQRRFSVWCETIDPGGPRCATRRRCRTASTSPEHSWPGPLADRGRRARSV